jgi:protein involved in polysaccharide export with SLBB domain
MSVAAWRSRAIGVAATMIVAAAPGVAQDRDVTLVDRPLATRQALEDLAYQLERAEGADSTRGLLLARVRARLATGDFRPGDLVLLAVQGEPALSDTFTIGPEGDLLLPPPTVGTLSLRGVLRSDLQALVAEHLGRFMNNPVVRARPLLRLSVQGEVARPGIYGVAADGALADALMAAGGTTGRADLRKLRVERGGKTLRQGLDLQYAFAEGRTLDEAGFRAGDQVVVGRRREGGLQDNLRFLWIVVSLTGGIYGISRWAF